MYFLLTLAAIYFGFRLLIRYVLPGFLARKAKEFQDQVVQQQRDFQEAQNPREEGETEIIKEQEVNEPIEDRPSYDDGDYIDFEEVE